jgi:hypothetical protein
LTGVREDRRTACEKPVISTDEADLYTDAHNAAELRKAGADGTLGSWIRAHLSRSGSGDYVALLAYVARDAGTIGALQKMRLAVRNRHHLATCAEFGPRFLHSTGQAYGGPDSGVFCRSPPTMPRICRCPDRRRVSASSRRREARRFRRVHRTWAARCASISRATSDRVVRTRCRDCGSAQLGKSGMQLGMIGSAGWAATSSAG